MTGLRNCSDMCMSRIITVSFKYFDECDSCKFLYIFILLSKKGAVLVQQTLDRICIGCVDWSSMCSTNIENCAILF